MLISLLLLVSCGGVPWGEPPAPNPVALTGAQLDYVGTWKQSTGIRDGGDSTMTIRADGTADYVYVAHSDGESFPETNFTGEIHITQNTVRIAEVARRGEVVKLSVTSPPTVAAQSGDASDIYLGWLPLRMGDTVLVAHGRWIRQDPAHRDSVAAQRARLGAAAECDDPVAGVWTGGSHVLAPQLQFWQHEELHLQRGDDGAVVATLHSHFWGGARDHLAPGTDCGELHYLLGRGESDASWTLRDGVARIEATGSPRFQEDPCGDASSHPWLPYEGTLDAEAQELTLTQDEVRGPLVLRRTGCRVPAAATEADPG